MSVIKPNRDESKLEFLLVARELCAHSLNLCKSEKNFPKRDRWVLTGDIAGAAKQILICVKRANRMRNDEADEARDRLKLQTEALGWCDTLNELLEVAKLMPGHENINMEHWVKLTERAATLIMRWKNSDRASADHTALRHK